MYRLRTLGGLAVEQDGRPVDAMAAHRKALCILVLLACHGRLGRERISVLLWPESDAERARGSLKQAIHLLRRQFGEAELITGTTELRLNPALLESDTDLFQRALSEGEVRAAVDLYGGPFLDGVHLDGAPEFESWVGQRRAEFFQGYTRALEELASEAESRGDGSEALQWWRRLQGADPFNGRVAVRLMQSLDRGGDRAAALRHARVHEVLFREELGIPPDPGVLELAERLRAEPAPTSAPRSIARGPEGSLAEAALTDREGVEGQPDSSREPMPPTAGKGPGGWSRTLEGRSRPRLLIPALAMAGIFLIGLWGVGSGRSPLEGGDGGGTGSPREGARADVPVSLAVLPFVDMSSEGDQEYFSDGVTEEILNVLTQRTDLRIPARSSSFHFKGRNLPIREIAAQLGVEAVLEGSVRKSGDRVRITAQLIDAREDRHLWSETFDRWLEDIFVVQTEIAEIVAQELRVRLSPTDHRDGPGTTQAPEAYDRYLRGLFHWNRRSTADLGLAVEFFQEATRLEPGFARAWAGLALAHAVIPIGFTPTLSPDEAWSRMEEAATRALALDSTLAEVHAARGLSYHFQWRLDDAEREYRRALALNPDYATGHQWYGEHLAKTGRGEEGVRHLRRAVELDPLSLVIHNDLGLVLMLNRQFPEAMEQWESTVRMDPGFSIPIYFLHRLHLVEGRLDRAADWGRRWAELTGAVEPGEILTLTRAVADATARPAALTILREWEDRPAPRWLDLAFYYTVLDERDAAFSALASGVRVRAPMMVQIGHSPWLDPLRGDPRMDPLLREVGFTPN